jgi:hypothetical protein
MSPLPTKDSTFTGISGVRKLGQLLYNLEGNLIVSKLANLETIRFPSRTLY